MEKEMSRDVIVVGAGPAGLMAAIIAARSGKKVLVLDGESRPGKKILISGGGHCNISNRQVSEADFESGQPRTVRNVLRAFPPAVLREFFSGIGVELVEDEDGKLFPATRSASTVLEALLAEADRAQVRIEKLRKVMRAEQNSGGFSASGNGFKYEGQALVIATGGLSYPETGSDGTGYDLARQLGHTVTVTTPALVPLRLDSKIWNSLTGITLPVEVSLVQNGKRLASASGPLLFTHMGLSGPCVMDLSRHWLRFADRQEVDLVVNFLPQYKEAEFFDGIARLVAEQPVLSLKRSLAREFPERLAEILLQESGLDPQKQMAHCSKKDRAALARAVFALPVKISGAFGYEKAEATAGGVEMSEVDPKTLGSKIHKGLFFAGEVLDVDGRIGGFNLHWAWASGWVVGHAAAHQA